MSRSGDLNINCSMQAFGDLTMERLKQAMLQHELIFRNQVCELHRLYWTQKNLMNELRLRVVDTVAPSGHSRLNKESEGKKSAFYMFSQTKERSLARYVGALEEFKGKSSDLLKDNQREFSLHLCADDFIPSNGKVSALYHQAGKGLIDLESSVDFELHQVTNDQNFSSGLRAPLQNRADMFGTQASVPCAQVSSSIIGNDRSQMTSVIHLSEEHGGLLQGQKFALSYVGIGDSCIDASVNQLKKKQQARPILFDLNVPHEYESSHDLKGMLQQEKTKSSPAETSFVPNSPLSDTPMIWQEKNKSSPAETSFVPNPPFSDTPMISHDKDSKFDCSLNSKLAHNTTDFKINRVYGCQIQAERCEGSTDSSGQGFFSINALSASFMDLCKQAKGNVDSSADKLRSSSHSDIKRQDSNVTSSNSINLPQTVNRNLVAKSTSHEESEEDTSSSHAIAQDERGFLTECNSHGISRNNESSNTDDSVTTQLNSSQNEGSLRGKLNSEECDATIVSAAEALVSILLGYSAIPIEQPDGIDASNLPQYSSDSFERMTLQLSEVQSEDRCIMSEPSNVHEIGKNEKRGIRLRRLNGFRDFQNEILPGLVTLSRHEICEDLHDIKFKPRRMTSINAKDNWFVPVRRRSKLCSGRPRRFSSS